MKLSDIKSLLTNKIATLEDLKRNAITAGDIEAVTRIELEIEETNQSINQIP